MRFDWIWAQGPFLKRQKCFAPELQSYLHKLPNHKFRMIELLNYQLYLSKAANKMKKVQTLLNTYKVTNADKTLTKAKAKHVS